MALKIRLGKYDKIWSLMVRERDGKCRNCGRGSPWKLEAHHIRPRGRKSTRYLLENGITLCVLCHKFGDNAVHQIGDRPFMEPLIGKKEFNRLEKLSLKLKSDKEAQTEFETHLSSLHPSPQSL